MEVQNDIQTFSIFTFGEPISLKRWHLLFYNRLQYTWPRWKRPSLISVPAVFFSSPIYPSLPLGFPASSTPSYSCHHSLILKTDSKPQPITHTKRETRAKMALGSLSEWHLKHFLCVPHPSTGASWGSIYLEGKTISHQRNEFVSLLVGPSCNICVKLHSYSSWYVRWCVAKVYFSKDHTLNNCEITA